MFHLQARLSNTFVLTTLCLLALSGCGGGGGTPSPIMPVLPDLPHKDAYAITKADPPGTRRSYITHAFLWQNGVMTDLNTLIAAKTGWDLSFAASINSKGQIVGFGTYKETSQIFLLTPR